MTDNQVIGGDYFKYLLEEIRRWQQEAEFWRNKAHQFRHDYSEELNEITSILADALGYPPERPGSPGHSPGRTHATGDHTATTLASEAADRIRSLVPHDEPHVRD